MKKRAYTLFELLVSISIIGILIAVASVSYGAAQKKARDARRIEDVNAIQKAAEMYYSQNSYVYPSTTGAFITGGVIQSWPTNPKGSNYLYTYTAASNIYCVGVSMDNPTGNCTSTACGGFGATTGGYYCVKNQQ